MAKRMISQSMPANFVVVFAVDTNEKELTNPLGN